jgi:hypothetical protein
VERAEHSGDYRISEAAQNLDSTIASYSNLLDRFVPIRSRELFNEMSSALDLQLFKLLPRSTIAKRLMAIQWFYKLKPDKQTVASAQFLLEHSP